MPNTPGLQTGRVVKLENDPAGEFRILIQIPALRTGKEIWARLSTFDAGSKRGAFFLPEIGDEVIVGFMNDDAAQPVILGMLYGKDRPPVHVPTDVNHHKSYTSRSGMQIHFDDETKLLEIKTPGGHHIVLDEKNNKIEIADKSSNSITLNSSGIKIKASTDITLEAAGKLNIKTGGLLSIDANDIDIKSRSNFKVSATNVSSTATASSELKGAMIRIN